MGQKSSIEWTDATWNPFHGCRKVSPGCKFCYMYADKKRYGQDPMKVVRSKTTFNAPLKWKEPKRIFTCSWSDWFIEEADAWRDEAYDIIRRTPQHTYQILTKRPERIAGHWPDPPLPNIWLGVSAENQEYAEERIPLLLKTPAAVRFLSYEPALGPINLDSEEIDGLHALGCGDSQCATRDVLPGCHGLDWVIVGGESGPGARPFDIQWARNVVQQCKEAGVACFVKQLGDNPMYRAHGDDDPRHLFNGLQKLYSNGQSLSRKGGEVEEWTYELRVREFPQGGRYEKAI